MDRSATSDWAAALLDQASSILDSIESEPRYSAMLADDVGVVGRARAALLSARALLVRLHRDELMVSANSPVLWLSELLTELDASWSQTTGRDSPSGRNIRIGMGRELDEACALLLTALPDPARQAFTDVERPILQRLSGEITEDVNRITEAAAASDAPSPTRSGIERQCIRLDLRRRKQSRVASLARAGSLCAFSLPALGWFALVLSSRSAVEIRELWAPQFGFLAIAVGLAAYLAKLADYHRREAKDAEALCDALRLLEVEDLIAPAQLEDLVGEVARRNLLNVEPGRDDSFATAAEVVATVKGRSSAAK